MRNLNALIERFNKQVAELAPEGYLLQGSVVKRELHRTTVNGVSKPYGPYYVWTRKIKNKTVTHALTAEQSQIIREAIQRNRQLVQRIARLHKLSEQIIYVITPCVPKRKRQHSRP